MPQSPAQTVPNPPPRARAQRLSEHEMMFRALALIQGIVSQPNLQDDYATVIMGLGPMILQSGLPQACAFLLTKGTPAHLCALRHLMSLLNRADVLDDAQARAWFENTLLTADRVRLRFLTRRALQAATILKRYTQAYIKTDDE